MDIFTHSIWWYLLKKNFYNKTSRKILSVFLISSIFPDIDVIWSYNNHDLHRVLTHSILTAPFICIFLSIIFYFIFKKEIKYYKLFLICLSWIFMHIFLDVLVIWWIPLFWPISDKYFSLDLYTYVIEPLFFPIYLLFFVFLLGMIKKINTKVIKIIWIYVLVIFSIKLWIHFYIDSLSTIKNNKIVGIITNLYDLSIQRYYKSIEIDENKIKWEIIDLFKFKVIETYEKEIYKDKNHLCANLHKWFLYIENWIIWDIRYSLDLKDTNSCFTWIKID